MDFCREYGYWGMCIISFLSGSILPFTSDVLMLSFLGMGMSPIWLVVSATVGNTLGGVTCYYMGGLAKGNWFSKFFSVSPEKARKAEIYIQKYGYWAAFFSFVAIIGEAIIVLLGSMRATWWKVFLVMMLGKLIRYMAIALSYEGVAAVI